MIAWSNEVCGVMTRKSDDCGPVSRDLQDDLKFRPADLEWYGEAYEGLYIQKLEIDDKLKALAEKLAPKKTILH